MAVMDRGKARFSFILQVGAAAAYNAAMGLLTLLKAYEEKKIESSNTKHVLNKRCDQMSARYENEYVSMHAATYLLSKHDLLKR
ncbi:hypothetical protein KIN20_014247 [Parelaphostrongylus tenuis]|uniref:Uncharacterized protein n=1 Tax=Parelaphostrongylus tenuis TaxID=148309 RepID=A0AAD5QRP6_PARTN|nr:hypothetical protein KIN20_014247 [Parelaphostrongylus tenuis]